MYSFLFHSRGMVGRALQIVFVSLSNYVKHAHHIHTFDSMLVIRTSSQLQSACPFPCMLPLTPFLLPSLPVAPDGSLFHRPIVRPIPGV